MRAMPASLPRPDDGSDYGALEAALVRPRSAGCALRLALVDFYHQSWRLLVLNAALSLTALVVAIAALVTPVLLVLLVLVGPVAAAVQHCAVVLAQTEDLRLGEFVVGLGLHWRRGLALAGALACVVALGVVAVAFYGDGTWTWPLAVLVAYVLALLGLLQLALWPLAVFERERPLGDVLRRAALDLLRRPVAFAGLGLALLAVNAAGIAAALVPFLTLTISYSFLAAAHFALPRSALREAGS